VLLAIASTRTAHAATRINRENKVKAGALQVLGFDIRVQAHCHPDLVFLPTRAQWVGRLSEGVRWVAQFVGRLSILPIIVSSVEIVLRKEAFDSDGGWQWKIPIGDVFSEVTSILGTADSQAYGATGSP
jgi:hypothetical protein